MELGIVTSENLEIFRSLLLPESAQALADGEPVTTLGLVEKHVAVGACAGSMEERCFQIHSFYVAPACRRMGGGRMLMDQLKKLTGKRASELKISFTATKEEHRALIPFLESMGFVRQEDFGESIYQVTLEQVSRSPFFRSGKTGWGTPFSQLDEGVLSAGERAARFDQAPLPKGGLRAPSVDRDVSAAYVQDGVIQAYVVGDTSCSGGLNLSAVWSGSRDPMVLPGLLSFALKRAVEKYPQETTMLIQTVNERSAALLTALLPEAAPISHVYVYQHED